MRQRMDGTSWSRREWIGGMAAALAAGTVIPRDADGSGLPVQRPEASTPQPLDIAQFQPRSMLRVPETSVPRAKYPVIDIHTHLTFQERSGAAAPGSHAIRVLAPASELLPVMDRRNLRTMVNLTGGTGAGLATSVREFQAAHPGRFLTFTEPSYGRASNPGYAQFQADELHKAHEAGARGLKVLKTLGLYLRERGTEGPLVRIDDPRFDPMWEACAALGIPVAIHIADPEAFFLPIDRFNERFEELNAHPDWSFHGTRLPAVRRAARRARPRLRAPSAHDLHRAARRPSRRRTRRSGRVARPATRTCTSSSAPASESSDASRERRAASSIATRTGSCSAPTPCRMAPTRRSRCSGDALYEIYFRFLESEDEYFDYAPAPIPPQGRWRIYGLGLPDGILKKVYGENAARMLRL